MSHLIKILVQNSSNEIIYNLQDLEGKLRETKYQEVILWKQKIKIKWLWVGEITKNKKFLQFKAK